MFFDPKVAIKKPDVGLALWAALLLGSGVFVWGVWSGQTLRAWQAYLVNLVLWIGACTGSVTLVAIMNLTNARWARPIKRFAEAPVASLPFLWVCLLVLYLGHKELYPWAHEPVHGKEIWLRADFLFLRDSIAFGAIACVCMGLVWSSVKGDLEFQVHGEIGRLWRRQVTLSAVLGVLYGFGMSVLAWDLIMSLDPHWVSTLFGGYYFMGSLYTGICLVGILCALLHKEPALRGLVGPAHFHDLGKLLLAFCLITGDFFYSQFLVIWYGNIPEETRYVISRVRMAPWHSLAWAVLIGCFALPFVGLLSRPLKKRPGFIGALGVLILIGMWFERFLLIVPSTWRHQEIPFGVLEIGTSVGFVGLVGLTARWFLSRVPWVPLGDPLFSHPREQTGGEVAPCVRMHG